MSNAFFSAASDNPSNYNVYLGAWTNWSRGPVFGSTLTLDKTKGSLLISFTAFFITIVATRFWRVACFILHQRSSSSDYLDALHHQHQAVFRNSSSSESGLWSLIQISWAWRHLAKRNLRRTVPRIIFAGFCLLVFSLASGLSSSISTAIGSEVLLDGTNCGIIDPVYLTVDELQQTFSPWQSDIYSNAAGYAQQVYSPNRTSVLRNGAFVRKTLNTITNSEASCPFKNGLCRHNASNLLLDTGLIDICSDLGVNLQQDACFSYRYVAHCAPLRTEGRTEPAEFRGFPNYIGYNYGPRVTPSGVKHPSNHTIVVEDVNSQNIAQSDSAKFSGYGLTIAYSYTYNGEITSKGSFYPEPDLRRTDADIFLVFLSGNGVVATEPVNDPWYQFNVLSNRTFYSGNTDNNGTLHSAKVYQSAEAASPLGCATQLQVCKESSNKTNSCGPLASFDDALRGADMLFNVSSDGFNSTRQAAEAYSSDKSASQYLWFVQIIQTYPAVLWYPVQSLGFKSLASQRRLAAGVQDPLPDDQWKLDVSNWWNITLAATQASFVDTARGPSDPAAAAIRTKPTITGQKALCENQKILDASYTSLSLFGLYFVYITGTLIILVSFILEPLLLYIQKRQKDQQYGGLEWACNETLQLQRLAYEESGQGDWRNCVDSVPVTASDQLLAPLNVVDIEHPLLRHPRSRRSSMEKMVAFSSSHEIGQAGDDGGNERDEGLPIDQNQRRDESQRGEELRGMDTGEGLHGESQSVYEGSGSRSGIGPASCESSSSVRTVTSPPSPC